METSLVIAPPPGLADLEEFIMELIDSFYNSLRRSLVGAEGRENFVQILEGDNHLSYREHQGCWWSRANRTSEATGREL